MTRDGNPHGRPAGANGLSPSSYLRFRSYLHNIMTIKIMRGVNKVILIGNATRDAELRQTSSGKAVSSLRLATNRKVGEGEETLYHTVICWDRLAETTAEFVKKGAPLYVEGRLQYRSYQDADGQERGVVEIVANDVQFLARRKDSHPDADQASRAATADDVSPDEIPF